MINIKGYFHITAAPGIWMALFALVSCRNTPDVGTLPPQVKLELPIVQPLKLSKLQRINLDSIKSKPVKPEVRSFDMDKLPVHSYDAGAYKPVKYQPEVAKFDMNALLSKHLDIDKLPTKPLHFKTYTLSPPKLFKAGARRLINGKMYVYELGEAQGLKADTVMVTFTDRDGFVWVGTDKGLYRYDGDNFWLFDSLPYKNAIASMLQDKQGLLWVTNFKAGVQVIDIKKGTVKTLNTKTGLNTDSVNSVMIDNRQRIWLTTWGEGINIIDAQAQTIKSLRKKDGLSSNECPFIAQDVNQNMWIGSTWGGGVNFIDLKNKKISYINTKDGLKDNAISAILCDHTGRVWVSSYFNGSIEVIDPLKKSIQTINESSNSINITNRLFEDKQGRIWSGKSLNGLEIIDPEKQTRIYLNKNSDLSAKFNMSICQDPQGQMWVAEFTKLNVIETDKVFLDQIGNTPTTSIFEDTKGLVWRAGDYDGVNIIDRQRKTIRTLNSTNGLRSDTMGFLKERNGRMLVTDVARLYIIDSVRRSMTVIGKKQGFMGLVRSWAVDKKGNIWLGSFRTSSGIDVYYPGSNTVKHIGNAAVIHDHNGDTEDMCTDTAGNIWISTFSGGVGIIDPNAGTIRYIDYTPFNDIDQKQLMAGNDGSVWIATKDGLINVNLTKKKLTLLTGRQGLIDKGVNSILERNGRIYAGTVKGVTIITPPGTGGNNKNWQFQSFGAFFGFDKKNGDPQSDLITRDGQYWMGDLGITVFNLPAQDTNSYPVYVAGLNIVNKPRFFAGDAPAKANGMYWDKVRGLANMPVNLHITYDQNFMQFHYGTLNPARHDTVWYKYRLAGADKEWCETTSATSTPDYINLSPGRYTFEVTSLKYNGTWSKPAMLSFTINPPWWQTWWAYGLYVILLGGSIWGFSHYRSLQLIKDKRILEHKVHIRTEEVLQQKEEIEAQRDNLEKAFGELKTTQTQLIQSEKMASLGELTAGIAHEIQNPLNFVNNFSEVNRELIEELQEDRKKAVRDFETEDDILNDIKANEQKINMHGKRADAIVKGMLQHSKLGSGAKELTDINALADEYMRLAYHGLRAKDKAFNAEMITHFDPALPKINAIPQDMGRVMLNLFNNAFYAVNERRKTAGAEYMPTVEITTVPQPQPVGGGAKYISIIVRDNGVGIPGAIKDKIMQPFFTTKPTGEGTGLGLSLTYDMVVKGHGGSINVDTKEGEFTIFNIQLPL